MVTVNEGNKRLDATLSSGPFAYKDSLSVLVKNHLLQSTIVEAADGKPDAKDRFPGGKNTDEATERWSSKIWTFLDEVKSVNARHTGKPDSAGSLRDWKLKDSSDRHRVMYREGPEGTPFHTLCLEGVIDGDLPTALCVAMETPMFKEWWPQFTVPTFKIVESRYLRRVRVGEDLSLIRVKVPWPVAPREVVMSVFELDYLQEDLILVLMESAPEADEVDEKFHGYSADDIPAPSTNVRMDLYGGFVAQKVSKDQLFFRTLVNMDIKLDFVPPWMINFISRQLAGQGLKLYQKAVTAVKNGTGNGKAFQKLLKTGYLYERIRSSLEAKTSIDRDSCTSLPVEKVPTSKDSGKTKILQGSIRRMGSSENYRVVPYPVKVDEGIETLVESDTLSVLQPAQLQPRAQSLVPQVPQGEPQKEVKPDIAGCSKQVALTSMVLSDQHEVREYEDPELDWALSTLERMILFTRSCAAEARDNGELRDCQVESTSSCNTKQDSKGAVVNNRRNPVTLFDGQEESTSSGNTNGGTTETRVNHNRKPPLPPGTNQKCNIVVVKPASLSKVTEKLENRDSSRSPGVDLDSSGTSGFWSTGEIEVVSSQDETDTDVEVSGQITRQPRADELQGETKRRRSRWFWTCFSPSYPKKDAQGSRNLYSDDSKLGFRDSGRLTAARWKAGVGDSNRFMDQRGYVTDGDDRLVTFGELLMEDAH